MPGALQPITATSEPDRFGRAFLIAAALEIIAFAALALSPPPPAAPTPPSVVQLQVLQPAPMPVAKPPTPTPTPPPPVPTPPVSQPITPPLPIPPPPAPHHPTARRVIHHVMRSPPPPQPIPPAPEPPAPITAAPAPSSVAAQTAMSHYTGEVRAIVLGNLIVPQLLVDAGLSGDCVLQFTLAPDGKILAVSVISPSGLSAVNQAAVGALRASHLPAFFPGMPDSPHVFTLPVHVSGADQ